MIYTNKNINLISLIITLIIFLILNIYYFQIQEKFPKDIFFKITEIYTKNEQTVLNEKEEIDDQEDIENWYIEIPKINLKAPIAEGTDKNILNKNVGHFSNTDLKEGNIGLAGYNKGGKNNYFENLKNLKIDDEIIYKYENYKKIYIIDKIEIIKNTNWRYLNKTDENKITLITGIENETEYRRCIQATEEFDVYK